MYNFSLLYIFSLLLSSGISALNNGADGFIGYHLSRKLLEHRVSVTGSGNIRDYYDTKAEASKKNTLITIMLHFTACVLIREYNPRLL